MSDRLLYIAIDAALAAGEAIMRVYAEPFEVMQKGDQTPVTEADLASERVIVRIADRGFPDIPIVSEETAPEDGSTPPAARFWCVDPLDGTKEFIAKNGEFAVCIGLIEDGRPVLGVVHGPAIATTYAAYGPGTAIRIKDDGAPERSARGCRPEGLTVIHSRTNSNSRRLAEYSRAARSATASLRQRAQVRGAGGGRGRPLPALWHDDGMGHRRRPGDPRSRRRQRHPRGGRPAGALRQARPQERRVPGLGSSRHW